MAARLADHPVLEEKIAKTRALLEEGQGFSEAISESQIFDSLSTRMISIGCKTGAVDMVMKQISLQYSEDINERIFQLISKLEPTLVAVLSIIVGLILLFCYASSYGNYVRNGLIHVRSESLLSLLLWLKAPIIQKEFLLCVLKEHPASPPLRADTLRKNICPIFTNN